MFNLLIPRFNVSDRLPNAFAEAAREPESVATAVALREDIKFLRTRGIERRRNRPKDRCACVDGGSEYKGYAKPKPSC
jgi:hypothetical protein